MSVKPWFVISLLLTPMLVQAQHHEGRTKYVAPHAEIAPLVNGIADDAAWEDAAWQPLIHNWLGPDLDPDDFQGRYKLVWTEERIYLLAEITDDILFDSHRHPLTQYWDDDCLEVFIDADFSGGDHQFNHNAFAYHFSLDNRAIDIGTDEVPRDYSHHVQSQWKQEGDKLIWEVSIDVYDDSYIDDANDNMPMVLDKGHTLGLMVAYCDNDGSLLRENFVGSEVTFDGKTDWGWKDAGLFGEVTLE